jgi:tetratricopeptide (TPR) repeat protein
VLNRHQVAALAADAAFKRAELAQGHGHLVGAIAAAQQATTLAPDQAEYYHALGQYYAALAGRTRTEPLGGFEPVLCAPMANPWPTFLGRDQLFTIGRICVQEALRRNPVEARYHVTLGELYRYWAEVAEESSHLAAALASFQQAAYLKPNDAEIYAGIADALLLRADPARAVEVGEHARALLPTYWYSHAVLARAYLTLGWPKEALEAAQRALAYASLGGFGAKPAGPYDVDRLRGVVSAARAALS